ncbi:hypothetical protein BDQ17DRAFT_1327439 [Cyathus striatus]|nr:hypothetical protein BDQ17DRAFT_1327439 [Cyathus striatus]
MLIQIGAKWPVMSYDFLHNIGRLPTVTVQNGYGMATDVTGTVPSGAGRGLSTGQHLTLASRKFGDVRLSCRVTCLMMIEQYGPVGSYYALHELSIIFHFIIRMHAVLELLVIYAGENNTAVLAFENPKSDSTGGKFLNAEKLDEAGQLESRKPHQCQCHIPDLVEFSDSEDKSDSEDDLTVANEETGISLPSKIPVPKRKRTQSLSQATSKVPTAKKTHQNDLDKDTGVELRFHPQGLFIFTPVLKLFHRYLHFQHQPLGQHFVPVSWQALYMKYFTRKPVYDRVSTRPVPSNSLKNGTRDGYGLYLYRRRFSRHGRNPSRHGWQP